MLIQSASTPSIASYLLQQTQLHPAFTAQDLIKQCYQAAFGADHLLSDLTGARAYFDEEYAKTPADDHKPLTEAISEQVVRVNLGSWKASGISPDWLFMLFSMSAGTLLGDDSVFLHFLSQARELFPQFASDFDDYLSGGIRPVHHSALYRETQDPRYRIVRADLARVIPVLQQIARKDPSPSDSALLRPFIISIDGRAASGKTTLASLLARLLDAPVIHMDDFFLPPELRTPQRYNTPGGNFHMERFQEEVLGNLRNTAAFSYRRFDCSTLTYGESVPVAASPYRIVEGSYAQHPSLGTYADVTVFSTISPEEQLGRIRKRNGTQMAEIFRSKWIPLEETYFNYFNVQEKADITL